MKEDQDSLLKINIEDISENFQLRYSKFYKKLKKFEFILNKNKKFQQPILSTTYFGIKYHILIIFVNKITQISVNQTLLQNSLVLQEHDSDKIFLVFLLDFKGDFDGKNKLELQEYYRSCELSHESVKKLIEKSKEFVLNNHDLSSSISNLEKRVPLEKLKKSFPISNISEKNTLNDLSSRDWLKLTKSWFVHNPPRRKDKEILHPAKYPEDLAGRYIKLFTKKGEIVFDPFLGVGSTIVESLQLERRGIGIELSPKYYEIAKQRCTEIAKYDQLNIIDFMIKNVKIQKEKKIIKKKFFIYNEDSRNIESIWQKNNLSQIDCCVTSPPYWNQLKRNSSRQSERKKQGLDTIYSKNELDLGNIDDYNAFLKEQDEIFKLTYQIMKDEGHLIIITNNIYSNNRMYPLAFDTVIHLQNMGWIPLDEQIWCQDDKSLKPFGIFKKYMGNRCHQYCLIFQKNS